MELIQKYRFVNNTSAALFNGIKRSNGKFQKISLKT